MALPILDGNQTSTTLATTVSGGAHYPNHIIASGTVTANVFGSDGYAQTPIPIFGDNSGFLAGSGIPIVWNDNENGPDTRIVSDYHPLPVQGDVGVSGSVTVSYIPSISGTVTANIFGFDSPNDSFIPITIRQAGDGLGSDTPVVGVQIANGNGHISGANPFNVSGTVTIGNSVTIGSLPVQLSTTTIGGTARLNVTLSSATTIGGTAPSYGNLYGGSDGTNLRAILVDSSGRTTVTGSVSILGTPSVTMGSISGTVTANVASTTVTVSALPSGALTTRFGSVTTANTAQISTAVTNASRKYLLAQNISAGTVTIGIGFSPTTTQGIQLTAGAGITFDSFVPTGAVWWLGATTGATWTILEA